MRSAARLTYDAVQAARDGRLAEPFPLAPERLAALYGAFAALDRARRARGALTLDLAEYRVVLDRDRQPMAIVPRPRLDSHRLIEEFMILANIAAAEELEGRHQACMYRVHDTPDPEKLAALRDFLAELGIPGLALAKGQAVRPALFNRVLERAAATPEKDVINELVLRTQAQAAYSPNNIGHFGLALPRYAHFTSPIRRYADLFVHRALLAGSAPARQAGEAFGAIAEHISATERRATAAERAALDRYRAKLLGGAVGTSFAARVTGVARFGLFVTLPESGTDGLVPISSLPSDYYRPRRRPPPPRRARHRARFRLGRRGDGHAGRGRRNRRPPGFPAGGRRRSVAPGGLASAARFIPPAALTGVHPKIFAIPLLRGSGRFNLNAVRRSDARADGLRNGAGCTPSQGLRRLNREEARGVAPRAVAAGLDDRVVLYRACAPRSRRLRRASTGCDRSRRKTLRPRPRPDRRSLH